MPTADLSHDQIRLRRVLIYFGLVYFSQGITQYVALINQPLRHYLNSRGLGTAGVADFLFIVGLPWVIKPLYGLISDFFPLLGYRRKSYLLLVNGIAALSFLSIVGIHDTRLLMLAMFMTGIGVAASDVIVDALMVEAGKETGRTRLIQGIQWTCLQSAAVLSGLMSYAIMSRYQDRPRMALQVAALVAMCVPLLAAMCTWFLVYEKRTRADIEGFKTAARALGQALSSWQLWFVLAFLCLVNFNPGPSTPLIDFLKEKRGFKPSDISLMDMTFSVGGALGALLFMAVLSRRLAIRWTVVIGILVSAAGMVPLAFIDSRKEGAWAFAAYGGTWTIATLCLLTLAAEACPKRAEAFVFAAMMSINNLAVSYSDKLGGRLFEGPFHREVRGLILISVTITLLGLLLVPFLPTRPPDEAE